MDQKNTRCAVLSKAQQVALSFCSNQRKNRFWLHAYSKKCVCASFVHSAQPTGTANTVQPVQHSADGPPWHRHKTFRFPSRPPMHPGSQPRNSPPTRLHFLVHRNADAAPAVSSRPSPACARRSSPAPSLLSPRALHSRFCHPVSRNPRSLNSFQKQKHTRKREGSPGAIAQPLRRIDLGEVLTNGLCSSMFRGGAKIILTERS